MSKDLDLDWYTYLMEDFKLNRDQYKTADKAVFGCPKCNKADVVRIGHVKTKIKKIGRYECSTCRSSEGIKTARKAFKDKHGDINPFELESVKEKIKETNLQRHGVEYILEKKEIREKGVKAALDLKKINSSKTELKKVINKINPESIENTFQRNDNLPLVFILTGCFGSGKSTVSNKLSQSYNVLDLDKKHTMKDAASFKDPVIFQVSVKASKTIKEFSQYFETKTIVIQENFETIKNRLLERNGKCNDKHVIKRIDRMKSIANNYADFTGTADECYEYLKKQSQGF